MGWANVEEEQELDCYSADDMSISDSNKRQVQPTRMEDRERQRQDDDDDDDSDESPHAHGPKTTSEKRRAQNDVLAAFAANTTCLVTQKEVEEAVSQSTNEEQLSIRDILAKQEATVLITNPRDYQTELFQRAKNGNIIAVLDTGSGKTHIATLLLKHAIDEELERCAKSGVPKTAFFLVSLLSPLHIFR